MYYSSSIGCSPIPSDKPSLGSQGFRIWSGPTLTSFEHGGKKTCIPDEWKALGEKEKGDGWAHYENGATGIAIREAAFREKVLTHIYSAYEVTLVYPADTSATDLELYEATTRNAFERIGKLYNDAKDNTKRTHTVLVTPGVPRDDGKNTPIYPDPRENLSVYVQAPGSARGEELMIHAVAHLYNRQRADLLAYQMLQQPIPPGDFQELEASWSEVIYRTSNYGRNARIAYLYGIHTAVRNKDFSKISSSPFNSNQTEFEEITQSIVVSADASFLSAQYGHYILGPLVMIATEGMLQRNKTGATIEQILTQVHSDNSSFFGELSKHLSSEEIALIKSWMFDGVLIPYELVEAGMKTYSIR